MIHFLYILFTRINDFLCHCNCKPNTHLILMGGALWYDLPPLPGHEIEQLVDEERGREGLNPATGDRDQLPTDGAAELASVPGEGGHDAVEALQANGVGAVEELGGVLAAVVHACKRGYIRTSYTLNR